MWEEGLFNINGIELAYKAKVYDERSIHGINEGRISKLSICHAPLTVPDWDSELLGYDRGWYKTPNTELALKALEYILNLYG